MNSKKLSAACLTLAFLSTPAAQAFDPEQHLLGDMGGIRSELADDGVHLFLYHIFDVYDDFSGAPESGTAYFGRQRVGLSLDLETLIGM